MKWRSTTLFLWFFGSVLWVTGVWRYLGLFLALLAAGIDQKIWVGCDLCRELLGDDRTLFVAILLSLLLTPPLLALLVVLTVHNRRHFSAKLRRSRRIPASPPREYAQLNPAEWTPEDYRDLSTAIVLYTQYRKANWPQNNEDAVVKEFGEERAKLMFARMGSILHEMQMIKVDWARHTLVSAGDFVRSEMKRRYSRLSDEALDALRWKYTFDNK